MGDPAQFLRRGACAVETKECMPRTGKPRHEERNGALQPWDPGNSSTPPRSDIWRHLRGLLPTTEDYRSLPRSWKRDIAAGFTVGIVALPLALAFGVSQTVIGLTLVAVGTSLPELMASVMAALRGRGDLALGNVVGSNIFNILSILGVTALIRPLSVPPEMLARDLWVMLAAALVIGPFLWFGWRIGRLAGVAMTVAYAAYLWVLV